MNSPVNFEQQVVNNLSAKIGQQASEIAILQAREIIMGNTIALQAQEMDELKKKLAEYESPVEAADEMPEEEEEGDKGGE